MPPILALAAKDLTLLFRVKAGWFFTFIWPILVAIFFGLLFGGGSKGGSTMKLAVADEDGSARSHDFIARLEKSNELDVLLTSRSEAIELVRRGKRIGAVVVPAGFGVASGRLFHGEPPRVETWMDPSRRAEAGMLEGLLFKQAAVTMQRVLSDPAATRRMSDEARGELASAQGMPPAERARVEQFLQALNSFVEQSPVATAATGDAAPEEAGWQPLLVEVKDIVPERDGPRSPFEVTFPQGVLWGILGCVMTFGIGIVTERSQGTLIRLEMAPLSRAQILAGKALACFAAITLVEVILYTLARVAFGVRAHSWSLLALAGFATAVAFVGIMMLIASLGKTEQAASGAGWAILMPLSMIGGGMIPLFAMPAWMVTVSHVSPVKWAIFAFEGALWRGFGISEMLLPCAILLAVGVATFAIGVRGFRGLHG